MQAPCAGHTGTLLRDCSWQSGSVGTSCSPGRSRSPASQNVSPFPALLYKVHSPLIVPVVLTCKGIETVERMCRPFLSPLYKNDMCLWSAPCQGEIGPQSRTSLLASLSRAAMDSSGLLPLGNCWKPGLCLDQEKSNSKLPFLLYLKMALGSELPLGEVSSRVSLLLLRGFISSFPFFPHPVCFPHRSLPAHLS